MRRIDIDEVQAQLLFLADQAAEGNPFIITKAGIPIVKVVPLDAVTGIAMKRLGFLKGEIEVPDDFDTMGQAEIEKLF